jgi:hypothetical protein
MRLIDPGKLGLGWRRERPGVGDRIGAYRARSYDALQGVSRCRVNSRSSAQIRTPAPAPCGHDRDTDAASEAREEDIVR